MIYLLVASLLWSLSFGILKTSVQALDPGLVGFVRLALSLALFAPLLAGPRRLAAPPQRGAGLVARLVGIGAIQYGLMYSLYLYAYRHLDAYQVALFTIFTPLYVIAWDDLRARTLRPFNLGMAGLAVAGAAVIQYKGVAARDLWIGFGLVQAANLCFAIGQVEYRRVRAAQPALVDHRVHGYLLVGGVVVTAITTTLRGGWASAAALDLPAIGALAYLGIVASGVGFFAFNKGATRVDAGALAAINNLKIPLGVAASLVLFGEETDLLRLAIGGGVMVLAVALAELRATRRPDRRAPTG
ncbi:MAG: EamA family transporter [Nannocystaceae bacterium]